MSVYVTMRVTADPAAFEEAAADHADAIGRIMGIAKANGLIGHRWFRGEAEVMAVDEWPNAESFQAFMGAAEAEIGPFMGAAGVSSPPEVTVWGHVEIDDGFGWGA
jgi:heme-degrading monooxygenase HmoA